MEFDAAIRKGTAGLLTIRTDVAMYPCRVFAGRTRKDPMPRASCRAM